MYYVIYIDIDTSYCKNVIENTKYQFFTCIIFATYKNYYLLQFY